MQTSFLRAAVKIALALALGGAVLAQTNKPASPAEAPAHPSGLASGVKVHGHWTIVVRNPDGSVATRREFDNAMSVDGPNVLSAVLAGFATPGGWGIALETDTVNSNALGPCPGTNIGFLTENGGFLPGASGACLIVQAGGFYTPYGSAGPASAGCTGFTTEHYTGCSPNLAVALSNIAKVGLGQIPQLGLQLQGQTQVTTTVMTNLDFVVTFINLCDTASASAPLADLDSLVLSPALSTTSPAQCQSSGFGSVIGPGTLHPIAFTGTELPTTTGNSTPGITVLPKQTVQVTVVITFS